jgi:hypothetical protein
MGQGEVTGCSGREELAGGGGALGRVMLGEARSMKSIAGCRRWESSLRKRAISRMQRGPTERDEKISTSVVIDLRRAGEMSNVQSESNQTVTLGEGLVDAAADER